jgi:hypothetical protein
VARATHRYDGHQEQWIELRMRIRKIAQTQVRYGHRMIRVLVNRERWRVGKDLVYRLYREEGLRLRKRTAGKRRTAVHRQKRMRPTGPNQIWAMELSPIARRRVFESLAETEHAVANLNARPLSILIVDIYHCKRRNDTFDHAAGDEALKTLGTVISACMRKGMSPRG